MTSASDFVLYDVTPEGRKIFVRRKTGSKIERMESGFPIFYLEVKQEPGQRLFARRDSRDADLIQGPNGARVREATDVVRKMPNVLRPDMSSFPRKVLSGSQENTRYPIPEGFFLAFPGKYALLSDEEVKRRTARPAPAAPPPERQPRKIDMRRVLEERAQAAVREDRWGDVGTALTDLTKGQHVAEYDIAQRATQAYLDTMAHTDPASSGQSRQFTKAVTDDARKRQEDLLKEVKKKNLPAPRGITPNAFLIDINARGYKGKTDEAHNEAIQRALVHQMKTEALLKKRDGLLVEDAIGRAMVNRYEMLAAQMRRRNLTPAEQAELRALCNSIIVRRFGPIAPFPGLKRPGTNADLRAKVPTKLVRHWMDTQKDLLTQEEYDERWDNVLRKNIRYRVEPGILEGLRAERWITRNAAIRRLVYLIKREAASYVFLLPSQSVPLTTWTENEAAMLTYFYYVLSDCFAQYKERSALPVLDPDFTEIMQTALGIPQDGDKDRIAKYLKLMYQFAEGPEVVATRWIRQNERMNDMAFLTRDARSAILRAERAGIREAMKSRILAKAGTTLAEVQAAFGTGAASSALPPLVIDTQGPVLFAGTSGPHGVFSNMKEMDFTLDGIKFRSAEHAFQYYKTLDPAERQSVLRAPTPYDAKKVGRSVTLRPNWDTQVKFDVMRDVLLAKFSQNAPARAVLLATGTAPLHENRDDKVWGGGPGYPAGQDHLGRILMNVREILRNDPTKVYTTHEQGAPMIAPTLPGGVLSVFSVPATAPSITISDI